jgi:oligoribonuclease NrnB/cAMP/cGMP phosphodiesterase (DHH superfamily)
MKCFFHSIDLDGQCSGAIIRKFFGECELRPINYGQPFPWDEIEPNEAIFMVDFSLEPFEDMIRLADYANLIWIDHHKTAIEAAEKAAINGYVPGLREIGKAGCELTWEWVQRYITHERLKVPCVVYLLGRYDVWADDDPQWESAILPFQYGMRTYDTDPNNHHFWGEYLEAHHLHAFISDTISAGRAILEYIKATDAKYMKAMAHTIMFEGLKCLAINRLLVNSLAFASMWDPKEYDVMLAYGFRGKGWTVSLYSNQNHVDCGEVAKKYGGGGHKGAAGFQCDELPWKEAINL